MQKAKAAYSAPKLIEYGKMEQLTRGPWGGSIDSIIGKVIGIGDGDGGFNPFRSR